MESINQTSRSQRSGRVRKMIKAVGAAAVIIAVVVVAQRFDLQPLLRSVLARIDGLGPMAPVIFVGLYILASVLLLPGSILTLGAGVLFGVVLGSITVSIAATLGATSAFLVGRYLARDWVAGRIAGNEKFRAIDAAVAREGWKIVLLTRLSPIFPFNLLNYAFGVTRVRLKHYFFASWLGMIPGGVMYVYIGSLAGDLASLGAGERTRATGEWVLYLVGLLATIAVTVFVTRLARRALAERISEKEPKTSSLMITFVLLVSFGASAASADRGVVERTFEPYATLLSQFLIERDLENDGLESAFDYAAALAHDRTKALLEEQDALLAQFDTTRLDTREKAVAFWNNAYNYFMMAHILKERPDGELVESVWDYGGRFNPFRANVFERDLFNVGGRKYALDEMQKEILLGDEFAEKGRKEARTHFTINCASVGCPPLRTRIYTAENIDALMTENTRRSLNTPRHLHLDGDTLYVSRLFDWYKDDFVAEAGSVKAFIKAYADDRVLQKLQSSTRIRHIDYDWSLNKPANFPGIGSAD